MKLDKPHQHCLPERMIPSECRQRQTWDLTEKPRGWLGWKQAAHAAGEMHHSPYWHWNLGSLYCHWVCAAV